MFMRDAWLSTHLSDAWSRGGPRQSAAPPGAGNPKFRKMPPPPRVQGPEMPPLSSLKDLLLGAAKGGPPPTSVRHCAGGPCLDFEFDAAK